MNFLFSRKQTSLTSCSVANTSLFYHVILRIENANEFMSVYLLITMQVDTAKMVYVCRIGRD